MLLTVDKLTLYSIAQSLLFATVTPAGKGRGDLPNLYFSYLLFNYYFTPSNYLTADL